jgi:hypothetical protein
VNIAAVITALQTRLQTGLTGTTIGGRALTFSVDSANPPTAVIVPAQEDPVSFDVTMDGQDTLSLQIKVLVSSADSRSGQVELLGYMARSGSGSIYAAVAADPTLGGACSYASVTHVTTYGDLEWGGQLFFGAEFAVEVE